MHDHTLDISHFQNLLDKSLTAYHLVNYIEQKLVYYLNAKELKLDDKWTLETGYYYVKKEGTSLIAFNINTNKIHEPFLIAAAHSDSPGLKLKIESSKHKCNVFSHHIEVYGGPIISTWTDRDLSLAGVVYFNKDGRINSELITIENIGIIPNVAIHLNRKANEGFAYDTHENIMIITSFKKSIKEKIIEKLQISEQDFLSCDLIFTASEPAKIIGSEGEFLASKNLDNKSGCHAIMNAFVHTNNNKNKVAVFFDNEEIGSATSRGADSKLLTEILERINHVLNLGKEEHLIKLNKSFNISMDGAHGTHPGYICKHDPNYQISLGKGVTIKSNANFKYATTASGCAKLKALAMKNNIKIQEIIMKANTNSGTTIGPIANSQTGIETIDIGTPMWGMHSLRETIAISDHIEAIKLLRAFFENWN
ncbi:Aspartyl aminopeptidase [Borrelia nietonii YOR]|uniref:M18 family aminopeptidase n=2 Tax=Borrelia TaxID=138 RepID=A0ABM5PHN0_9SPIR|nr:MULTISPECIES: M18 family aminopeptidase [Borrelia]AHH03621.1 Aspartyl aminopeptidase [Borrelia nietonii YOR]AHH14124.1 Aspartyl aminopeptidase [Borrelia hermsii MTW]UPA09318.1 M18 family aminopeptidase [Borrelia nietonii YOR]